MPAPLSGLRFGSAFLVPSAFASKHKLHQLNENDFVLSPITGMDVVNPKNPDVEKDLFDRCFKDNVPFAFTPKADFDSNTQTLFDETFAETPSPFWSMFKVSRQGIPREQDIDIQLHHPAVNWFSTAQNLFSLGFEPEKTDTRDKVLKFCTDNKLEYAFVPSKPEPPEPTKA